MSDQQFERAVNDWLGDGSDRTPPRAIDGVLLAVKTTPQEWDLGIPWRFPPMPAMTRVTGIAAVALVAVVGAGALIYLNSRAPSGPGGAPPATQAPTPSPTVASTPEPSYVAQGITGWTAYTSAFHGFTMGYPEDWTVHAPASREWRAGDLILADSWPYADTFVSPGSNEIGLWVWDVPAAAGADLESVGGLKAWAATFCEDMGLSACATFTQAAAPMCLNAGGDSCRAAILVSRGEDQYAFFEDFNDAAITGDPVEIGRASCRERV